MSKEIDGTEYACLTINAFLEEENKGLTQRISELEEQLKNAIVPKFKYHQVVYALCNSDIIKGQIDCFDYYNKKYLIWTMDFGLGNEWCYEHELFTTEEEAQAKLKELQGE